MHEKEVEVLKNRFVRVSDNTEANTSFLSMLQPPKSDWLLISPHNVTLKSNIKARRIEEISSK